jgi:prepilin-type N-terminal cleavage/methylation domain-containing protein
MKNNKWHVTSDERKTPRGEFALHSSPVTRHIFAFTLIELLVVISIMGIIAALAVPALKNLGKSNVQAGAARQLLDDIGRARQLAISQHRTVYMVFVTTNFFNLTDQNNVTVANDVNSSANFSQPSYQMQAQTTLSNLVPMQLCGYNFISLGQVGDQPGQHVWHYLSTWQALPTGTFIAAAKFLPQNTGSAIQIPTWQQDYPGQIDNWYNFPPLQSQIIGFATASVPFPTENWNASQPIPLFNLPCLAFDSTGRLISETQDTINYHHAYIPLAQGTVGYGVDVNKQPVLAPVLPNGVSETPPGNSSSISYNIIDVDPLSGRAHLVVHQIQ